jgi:hypothetical protein
LIPFFILKKTLEPSTFFGNSRIYYVLNNVDKRYTEKRQRR